MPDPEQEISSAESGEDKPALGRMEFPLADKEKAKKEKSQENKVIRLLEKNPLGMTLPEMAGGPRQVKKMKLLRPMLAEAIRLGVVMPVSQRAGSTVYKLVKNLGPR